MLDIPVATGLARATKRRGAAQADRFEGEGLAFHEQLRQAYLKLAAAEPDRCVVVDARAPKPNIGSRIWSIVNKRLQPKPANREAASVTP